MENELVSVYDLTVSKVGLKLAGLVATSYGMRAIMKTGILQKIGIRLGKSIKKVGADERGPVGNNEGSKINWGSEHGPNNLKHNNAVENELDWLKRQGAESILKNRTHLDA